MYIAIASYSFHGLLAEGKMDLFGYLESLKYRYRVHAADIWNGSWFSTDEAFLAKLKEGLQERELELANLCVDGPHLWEDDPAVRAQHHVEFLKYMHAAEVLGARTIRIDAGGRGETYTDEQMAWIVNLYREYAQRAYDNGYKVGPENHWGTEAIPANMVRICEAVAHPGFGMLLHFRGNEGDALMAPWAMHTHISWDIAENYLDESIQTLAKVGYKGAWSVEHHSAQDEYARVAIQYAKVRDAVARLVGW
jgi:sugar phosphate isomerase/epimerase